MLREKRKANYFQTIKELSEAWRIANDEMFALEDIVSGDEYVGKAISAIQANLDRDQFIDFSLMVRLVVEGIERGREEAIAAVSPMRHLMVDEYQDINASQERLISSLHRRGGTLFAVGDDDQSIYGWRGADVTNILDFEGRYPGAARHVLETNYRSTRAIVEASNRLISGKLEGKKRLAKRPVARESKSPRDFRALSFSGREHEAGWVADRVAELLGTEYVERDGRKRGLTPGDFAILMRSTKQKENDDRPRHKSYSDALKAKGIPVTLEAGGSPFDVRHVEVIRDAFLLFRGRSPERGALTGFFQDSVIGTYGKASFDGFVETMGRWSRMIHSPEGSRRARIYPQDLLHDLLHAFGIHKIELPEHVMSAVGVFSRIIQDVESVYVSVDSTSRFSQVLNFLQNVADSGYDLSSDDLVRSPDAVTVSTVHKVKGLEFPAVFVVDVEQGRFPRRKSQYDGWMPENLIQPLLDRGRYNGGDEEETRLFYTALTRAERYLYVTCSYCLPEGKKKWRESEFMIRLTDREIKKYRQGMPEGIAPAPQKPRIAEVDLPTSFSEIRYYLRCPKDYEFRHRFKLSPTITEMFGFGKTVHASVAKLHETFSSRSPSEDDAERVVGEMFHLKHIPPSRDPKNRPGGYERAKGSAQSILRQYARSYGKDFLLRREVEARFEIPIRQAVISGAIDLLIRENEEGEIVDASVIDFKSAETDGSVALEEDENLEWTELAIQVQLYAKVAKEVFGENARAGAIHLLKNNKRVMIPVGAAAVGAAVENVLWAVDGILADDFPMRPGRRKCRECDFRKLCPKKPEEYKTEKRPPKIHLPGGGKRLALAVENPD